MEYAAIADLVPRRLTQKELVQLTDDTNTGVENDQIVNDILTEASGMIESYCRQRYAVPLQASEQIKGLCLDIAVYSLFSRRRNVPETIKDRYTVALQFLKDVASGKAALDQAANATAPQSGAGPVVVSRKNDRFGDHNLEGFTGRSND